MTKINFTKRGIDSIPLPDKGKRVTYYDAKTKENYYIPLVPEALTILKRRSSTKHLHGFSHHQEKQDILLNLKKRGANYLIEQN